MINNFIKEQQGKEFYFKLRIFTEEKNTMIKELKDIQFKYSTTQNNLIQKSKDLSNLKREYILLEKASLEELSLRVFILFHFFFINMNINYLLFSKKLIFKILKNKNW